jgi:hypothetical protein
MSDPSSSPPLGQAEIRRFLHREQQLALAVGEFAALFRAYIDHVERWELPADGLTLALMREGLAASALHLTSRPLDEMFGITINIKTPPLNLFVAGDARAATLTGRAFTEGVKTTDMSRFFVQAQRLRGEPTQSTIDVQGLDVLGMFEDYYRRSEQTQARFFDLDEDRFLMVLALPDSDGEGVAKLEREAARALLNGEARALDERTVVFRCGCNLEKVLKALRDIFGSDPNELFQGENSVETFCPRCGSRWMISRKEFETSGQEDA